MNRSGFSSGQVIGGLILIAIGVLALVGNLLRFDVWHYLWPFFIVGFGLAFFVGMIAGGKSAGALAIPGSLFVTLGLLFFVQTLFNHYASWAYAWALVAPASVGVGMLIFARWSNKPELAAPGRILITIGLVIFLVAGLLYETAAGLLGFARLGNVIWPLLLILLGVLILFGRSLQWLNLTGGSTPPPQGKER